jgi:hypothetical protein
VYNQRYELLFAAWLRSVFQAFPGAGNHRYATNGCTVRVMLLLKMTGVGPEEGTAQMCQ